MLNRYFKGLVAAAAVGGTAIGVMGCDRGVSNGYKTQAVTEEAKVSIRQVLEGNVFRVADGIHEITIPGERLSSGKDTTCIMVKDRESGHRGYSGLSCDFGTPKP